MQAMEILKQFDLDSELRLVQSVSNTIQASQDPLRTANSVLTGLGIAPVAAATDATLAAICACEFAWKNVDRYDVTAAIPAVETRYNKLVAKLPFGHTEKVIKLSVLGEGQSVEVVSDKHARARVIFDEMVGKVSKNQIVKAIAEQLKITVGNAGFLVYRKFAK